MDTATTATSISLSIPELFIRILVPGSEPALVPVRHILFLLFLIHCQVYALGKEDFPGNCMTGQLTERGFASPLTIALPSFLHKRSLFFFIHLFTHARYYQENGNGMAFRQSCITFTLIPNSFFLIPLPLPSLSLPFPFPLLTLYRSLDLLPTSRRAFCRLPSIPP